MTRRDDLEALRDLIANMTFAADDVSGEFDNAATLDALIEKAREIGPPKESPCVVIVGRMESIFEEFRGGEGVGFIGGEIKADAESASFRAVMSAQSAAFAKGFDAWRRGVRVTIERIEE